MSHRVIYFQEHFNLIFHAYQMLDPQNLRIKVIQCQENLIPQYSLIKVDKKQCIEICQAVKKWWMVSTKVPQNHLY